MDIVSTKAELQTQKAKDFFARLYGKETVPVQLQRYLSVVEGFEIFCFFHHREGVK